MKNKKEKIKINWNKMPLIVNIAFLVIGIAFLITGFVYGNQVEIIMGEPNGISLLPMGYVGIGLSIVTIINLLILFFKKSK